jgi:hypothetical protein
MLVTVNEQPLNINTGHLHNLEEALMAVNDNFIPQGEQLFQVKINGDLFSERYPRESRYIELESIASLDIHTVTDQDMARAILRQTGSQIDMVIHAIEKGATLFRLADESEANFFYSQVLDSLRWMLQVGHLAGEVLKVDMRVVQQPGHSPGDDFLNRLTELLDEMAQVHQEEDFILLADLMEYELIPVVMEWKKIIARLEYS